MPRLKDERSEKRRRRAAEWKRFREQFLFTQEKLAEMLGLSRRTVQEIEAGNSDPHLSTLRKFAAFRLRHQREKEIFED